MSPTCIQLTKDFSEELTLFSIEIFIRSRHVKDERSALHLESQAEIILAEAQQFIEPGFIHDLMLCCTTVAIWHQRCTPLIWEQPSVPIWRFIQGEDPKNVFALLQKAFVFGETNRDADCAAVLTRVLELDPRNVNALAGRGVMRARLKQDAEAIADARAALDRTFAPIIVYQVAGVYARVSARQPEYADEALALLRIALRAGAGHEHLATDPELEPLRGTPAFDKILADAKKARPVPPK